MKAVPTFNTLAVSLSGQPISHVWNGDGSAIFLEIGELTPATRRRRDGSLCNPRGQVSLAVESSWRIEDNHTIVCGSWDEKELWPAAFDNLRQGRIKACRLFGMLPEIEVVTETGLRLLSFSTAGGQPEWYIIDRRGEKSLECCVKGGKLQLTFPKA